MNRNLLQNSGFEHIDPWYNWQKTNFVGLDNAGGVNGSRCVVFNYDPNGMMKTLSQSLDIIPGKTYQFRCVARRSAVQQYYSIIIQYKNLSGQWISVGGSIPVTTAMGAKNLNISIPAGVSDENVWVQIGVLNTPNSGDARTWMDNVELWGDDQIGNGAIDTYRRTIGWTTVRDGPSPYAPSKYSIWPNALMKIREKRQSGAKTMYRVARISHGEGWVVASDLGLEDEFPVGSYWIAKTNDAGIRVRKGPDDGAALFGRWRNDFPCTVTPASSSDVWFKTYWPSSPGEAAYIKRSAVNVLYDMEGVVNRARDLCDYYDGKPGSYFGDPDTAGLINDWCQSFVNWVHCMAGINTNNIPARKSNSKDAYEWYEERNALHHLPELGDTVFYKWANRPDDKVSHSGFVTEVSRDRTTFSSWEANRGSGDTNVKKYTNVSVDHHEILGFGRPLGWDEA